MRRIKVLVMITAAMMVMFVSSAISKGAKAPKKCVVVWSEGTAPAKVYPNDINGAIADGLKESLENWEVVKAGINDPEQGLPDKLLKRCDVLIWWGHKKHRNVDNKLVDKIEKRVKEDGMGFISLHSAHFAKINKRLMKDKCSFSVYRQDSTTLTITVSDKGHPITKGVDKEFTVEHGERYSDPYVVPKPDAVVLDGVAALKDGKTDASKQGYCWTIGKAKMFYLQVGHETNPVYFDKNIRKIMANAVEWAAPGK